MAIDIIEIKAKCTDIPKIGNILQAKNADFKGSDHQIDTYFKVPNGRLKLREGDIENTLIHYDRPNQAGPKNSKVTYQKLLPDSSIKAVLSAALEVLTIVDKKRSIYFINNVKFHLDEVKGLGTFVEIEAIDEKGTIGIEQLRVQCDHFTNLFGIEEQDLVKVSYSDLLLQLAN